MAGGDDRFAGPTPANLAALTPEEVRAWIEPELRHGPVEMAIVGDLAWEDAAAAVAATLGALPPRDERTPATTAVLLGAPQHPGRPVYLATTDPSLRQVALAWLCPAPDVRDAHAERRCRLLAALVAERLRVRLRTDLGAAYGFDGDFVQTDGFPDLNFFAAGTTVSPAHARRAKEIVEAELSLLQQGKFSDDEFDRVRQPFLRSREKDLRDNSYWCYTVLRDPQLHPERLDAARDRQSDCAAITRADLAAVAGRYFGPEHWFQFVAYPGNGRAVAPLPSPTLSPRGAGLSPTPGSH
jgi:zinc protease